MSIYYNEFDPFAAEWIKKLITLGALPYGDVDTRDIRDVKPSEIINYAQCHFFAGIGGWSLALRNAGWSGDRPVWTGSCPCQPFSTAGRRSGTSDERHLWPHWFHLISECRPSDIFGEQVASKDGRAWLDLVSTDLETLGYAVGSADLCAAGVGAPHIRQRLWFYGRSVSSEWDMALRAVERHESRRLADAACEQVGNAGQSRSDTDAATIRPHPTNGFWAGADWIGCRDNKFRPVEPGTFPLADGVSNRVGRLRGYGNAIVPEVAEVFIEATQGW